jgi:hypothetical protein
MWDGKIDLDPCASSNELHHFARRNHTIEDNGLSFSWHGNVFVNPPFGDLARWVHKCTSESFRAEIVLLLPSRTDTAYWQDGVSTAAAICYLRGRLRFVGAPAPCPFPTSLAFWTPGSPERVKSFIRHFSPLGVTR